MKRLIVNADDFGRTSGINRGIAFAHRTGIVTSATLMVNYAPAREAAELAGSCPRLGLGLHLALTGGLPTLPPEQVGSLVDSAGRLPGKPEGLDRARPGEVLAEARAQLRRFREIVGRNPTHLDSHHHSHRLPVVLEAMVTLAGEEVLPVRGASPQMRDALRASGVRTTDAFVESFYDEGATLPGLLAIIGGLTGGTTELMCHPAYADPELLATSGYAAARERELSVLSSPEVLRAVQERELELINFAEL